MSASSVWSALPAAILGALLQEMVGLPVSRQIPHCQPEQLRGEGRSETVQGAGRNRGTEAVLERWLA